jgi:hypothetical protein
MREKRNAYWILVGKLERKRLLGRPRHRWEDNITIDLRETRWGSVDWIDLTQGRGQWTTLAKKVMKLQVPYSHEKFKGYWAIGDFSRRQLHTASLIRLLYNVLS